MKSAKLLILVLIFPLLIGIFSQSVRGGYIPVQTGNWTFSMYDDKYTGGSDSYAAGHSVTDNDLKTDTDNYWETSTAKVWYDTSKVGNTYRFEPSSGLNYRAFATYKLNGNIDSVSPGYYHSYLAVILKIIYFPGSQATWSSSTQYYYSGTFDGSSTYTITTSTISLSTSYDYYIELEFKLYCEGSFDEADVYNDFTGVNDEVSLVGFGFEYYSQIE